MQKTLRLLWFILIIYALNPQPGGAVGSSALSNEAAIGAKALGHLNAVTTLTEDATVVYFNPAGLPFLKGQHVSLNNEIIDYKAEHQAPTGEIETMDNDIIHVPSVFYAYGSPNEKWGIGVGVHSTMGLETRWRRGSFAAFIATISKIKMVTINPSIGWKATDFLSVGGGISFVRIFDVDLKKRMDVNFINGLFGGGPSVADGDSEQVVDGNGVGTSLGALFSIGDRQRFGLSYRSKVKVDLDGYQELRGLAGASATNFGGETYRTGAKATLTLPPLVSFGYGIHPTDPLVRGTGCPMDGLEHC